mmetsp:Transcript_423/g.797  ORF Transcript_423/g.797 Transcript_423/m.797 type:complete len:320 (+) Transcript_423:120-1079(+)
MSIQPNRQETQIDIPKMTSQVAMQMKLPASSASKMSSLRFSETPTANDSPSILSPGGVRSPSAQRCLRFETRAKPSTIEQGCLKKKCAIGESLHVDLEGSRFGSQSSCKSPRKAISDVSSPSVNPRSARRFDDHEEFHQRSQNSVQLSLDESIKAAESHGLERSPLSLRAFSKRYGNTALAHSDETGADESPELFSLRSGSGHPTKTLASIGQSHVTFSPTRVSIRSELQGVRRTEDARVEKRNSCEDFTLLKGEEPVFSPGGVSGLDNRFKTVDLNRDNVTEWFTGKSRSNSIKILPTIFEDEDEVDNDEGEQQEEAD